MLCNPYIIFKALYPALSTCCVLSSALWVQGEYVSQTLEVGRCKHRH